jgi:hypothetical protein
MVDRGEDGPGSRDHIVNSPAPIVIAIESPFTSDARSIENRYYEDIVSRYYGRPALPHEIAEALDHKPEALGAPRGILLLAREGDTVVGCAGVRLRDGVVGEVTRVFVAESARG